MYFVFNNKQFCLFLDIHIINPCGVFLLLFFLLVKAFSLLMWEMFLVASSSGLKLFVFVLGFRKVVGAATYEV